MAPPLVYLVHGFLGDCDDWGPVAEVLGTRARCVGVALPGHTAAATAGADRVELHSFSLDGAAEQLAQLTTSSAGATVVGYSMGGRVALRAASLSPQSFARLLLLSTQPGIDDPAARTTRAAADLRLAHQLERMNLTAFRRFLHEWYGAPLFGDFASRADFAEIVECRARQDPRQLASALRAFTVGAQLPLWDTLLQLGQRCRYLSGIDDTTYAAVGAEIRQRAPGVEVYEVTGAAHALHREAPAVVAGHLIAMLDNGATL